MERSETENDFNALNEFVVNCPDFQRFEQMIGGFNLFEVLQFAEAELRHSNMLAWLFQPSESHGLDAIFLKHWLMRVLHESDSEQQSITVVEVDTSNIISVEVRREWKHIDLLLIITISSGERWIVCIENKINSTQHTNQLKRYHEIVDKEFSDIRRKIYIFLRRNEELPEDDAYIVAGYKQVHSSLKNCLEIRKHSIGSEPAVLINNYLRLLEERFMDESEIAKTAQQIYLQHKRALDLIFAHRPNSVENIALRIGALLREHSEELGIFLEPSSRTIIRFCPKEWDIPNNRQGGRGWSGSTRTVLIEISFGGNIVLAATSGYAPEKWTKELWERASDFPFNRPRYKEKKRFWCRFHQEKIRSPKLVDDESFDPEMFVGDLFNQIRGAYLSDRVQSMIQEVATRLPLLEIN